MPFTTFFRYDSNGLAEIYTRDREGNRTLNYQANSGKHLASGLRRHN